MDGSGAATAYLAVVVTTAHDLYPVHACSGITLGNTRNATPNSKKRFIILKY